MYMCVCGRTYYFNWQEAHKKESFWGWLKIWVHFNMLVVLYEEISNVSHVLQMFKNELKMSFCLPETFNYLKSIFLRQHQYLLLCASFTVWMLDLSFHMAVKKWKPKTFNKANNRIWFQDYFPWLKLFFVRIVFLRTADISLLFSLF